MMIGNFNTINMTYNALTATNNALEKTTRALSTGLKAAHASDDASGTAIGTNISAQVAGLDRAVRNAQDGISLLQTAEGGLNQINSMLQRMRELSVQAANDTLTVQDRGYIQNEIDQLRENINSVANTTTFNGKRLLDGSSAATWSSDNANTKLKASGALTQIDQFGQKKHIEGNYRIEIKGKPGQGEVQKTNIFNLTVAEEYSVRKTDTTSGGVTEIDDDDLEALLDKTAVRISLNSLSEGDSGEGWNFTNGTLNLTEDLVYSVEGTGQATTNKIAVQSGVHAAVYLKNVNIDVSSESQACAFDLTGAEADVYLRGSNTLTSGEGRAGIEVPDGASLTITSANGDCKTSGRLRAEGGETGAGIGGPGEFANYPTGLAGNITIYGGTIYAKGNLDAAGIGGGESVGVDSGGNIAIHGGNITANGGDGMGGAGIGSGHYSSGIVGDMSNDKTKITITGGTIQANGGEIGGAGIGGGIDSDSGEIRIRRGMRGSINATGGNGAEDIGKGQNGQVTDVEYIDIEQPELRGLPGTGSSSIVTEKRLREATLADISQFYNASSVFLLDEPQTITITQGNGRTASFTLYGTDTISAAARKINDAIADGLGQGAYVDNKEKFCTIADGTSGTSESVRQDAEKVYDSDGKFIGCVERGTLLIRSAVAGSAGRLTFSAISNDLINALGLNTIQEAEDNQFTASVYNAHSGKVIASNVSTEGNFINGALGENTSIEFDSMANIKAQWDEASKRYILVSEGGVYTTTLHVQDKSTSFQIGQQEGQDIYLNIGDMSAEALGISKVNVMTRENAAKSITLLDAAIHKVGSQRSKIGAYQNELEYNMNSLKQAGIHFQESESRIKDADMAREYMDFVKYQILNQTGNSMLSQSSQNARNIMSVLTM